MQILETKLAGVQLVVPRRHGDARGWFAEMYNEAKFAAAGLPTTWVQDNQSRSARGVLRGLHFQLGQPQGKLVRVLSGHIWDVAVDLRRGSPNFGQWAGFHLRPETADGETQMLWIPEGFGHGFLVLSETAEVLYKVTRPYHQPGERSVHWNDPDLGIDWPLAELEGAEVSVSPKDDAAPGIATAELPEYATAGG